MSDLISREALREQAIKATKCSDFAFDNCYPYWQMSLCIKNAPTVDAVEVVFCKDCIYQKDAKVNCKGFIICPVSNMEITDDDYCSYGERRESEVSE